MAQSLPKPIYQYPLYKGEFNFPARDKAPSLLNEVIWRGAQPFPAGAKPSLMKKKPKILLHALVLSGPLGSAEFRVIPEELSHRQA